MMFEVDIKLHKEVQDIITTFKNRNATDKIHVDNPYKDLFLYTHDFYLRRSALGNYYIMWKIQ